MITVMGNEMKNCSICFQHHIEDNCPHCSTAPNIKGAVALSLILGVGLNACSPPMADLYGVPDIEMDADGDGFYADEDCDDEDANTYPGAAFEDSETACMTDADGDGYGADGTQLDEGSYAEPGTDCDDSDPDVNPDNENCEGE